MVALTSINLIGLAAIIWVIGTVRYIWWRFFSYQNIPKTIPWVGIDPNNNNPFTRAKIALKSFFGLKPLLVNGYQEYSKKNRIFVLPNIVNGHEVILPTNQMQWLLEQPDTVLSQYETNRQFMCGDYTMLDLLNTDWPRIIEIVKRTTTRELDTFVDDIADETQEALKELWGSNSKPATGTSNDSDWHEIDIYDIMLEVVTRAAGRVFVGNPLCRNPDYIQASSGWAKYVLLPAMAIEMLPSFFKPIWGPILTSWDYFRHYKRIKAYISPMIKERLVQQQQQQSQSYYDTPTKQQQPPPPNDYITWSFKDFARHNEDPSTNIAQTCELIAKRLAITSFTSIQSTAITMTNVVVDIASTPFSYSVQEALRAELTNHFQSFAQVSDVSSVLSGRVPGIWSRPSLSKLTLLDGALTETLRLWGILTHGVTKVVVHPSGVTLPSGEHIPRGAKVGIASYGPHLDEAVYGVGNAGAGGRGVTTSSPLVWDPFRFAGSVSQDNDNEKDLRYRGSSGSSAGEEDSGSGSEKGINGFTDEKPARTLEKQQKKGPVGQPGLRFVTTSEYYMGFSHGKHACPGRFFANSFLKIVLAHIILMYDIQPLEERPSNPWLNNTIGPPIGTKIKVRRRMGT